MRCQCGADGAGPCSYTCAGFVEGPIYGHANPPPGYALCTRRWPHDGPCAHPPISAAVLLQPDDYELHAWPIVPRGGQHTNSMRSGVLAVHKATGVAVACETERSQYANRTLALHRLGLLVGSTIGAAWRAR